MIDVTFLLLIYFLLTTVLVAPEDALSPMLQVRQDSEAAEGDFDPHVVEVRMVEGEPAYTLGARVLRTRNELRVVLNGLPSESGVFITVHDHVPVGFAVAAIQTARDAGFEQVTYVPY